MTMTDYDAFTQVYTESKPVPASATAARAAKNLGLQCRAASGLFCLCEAFQSLMSCLASHYIWRLLHQKCASQFEIATLVCAAT